MKFKLVYVVHGVILILFVSTLIFDIQRYLDYAAVDKMTWTWFFDSSQFRRTLFFILPTFGVFIKSIKGWVFICQFFYFLFIGLILMVEEVSIAEQLVITIILLIFLLLLNYKKIYGHYNIKKQELLKTNIISFFVGFFILFIALVTSEYNYL